VTSDGPTFKERSVAIAGMALFWVIVSFAVTFYVPSHLPPFHSDISESARQLVPPGGRVTRSLEGIGESLMTRHQAAVYFSHANQPLLEHVLQHAEEGGWTGDRTKRTLWGWQVHMRREGVFAEVNLFEEPAHESSIVAERDAHRDTELAPYCFVAGAGLATLILYLWKRWRKSFEFVPPSR
jgi:hypothetical protein